MLHLLVYYVAALSLYGIVSALFDSRTALISVLFMGSYPLFLRAVGWDYLDGFGIAQMLLLLLLLTKAAKSPNWKLYLFLAGVLHSALLITNLFWLGFAPSWIAHYLLLDYKVLKFNLRQLAVAVALLSPGDYFLWY